MDGTDMLDCPLHTAAFRDPEAPAVVRPGGSISYGGLERCVAATARRLATLGGGSGGRVGLYVDGAWETLVLVLASMRAGVVACLVSTRVPPQGVAPLLGRVAAAALVTDRGGLDGHLPPGVVLRSTGDVLADGEVRSGAAPLYAADRPVTVVFTSGTTGTARAALHSVGNHVFSARGSNANIALAPGDRWLLVLPLYHVGGLGVVFRCLEAGAAVVLPEPGETVGSSTRRYGVTHVSLVASQLARLLEEGTPGAVRAVLVGGSAVPRDLVEHAHARGWPVHTTYGLTEMASQVTTTPPGAGPGVLATAGRVLPHRELRVGADGEIAVRGATRFLGYMEGATLVRPFDAEGWFHTGDLGWLDPDGWLHLTGRKDQLIISGGENIQPEEVEAVLCGAAGVRRAVVVPVEDATYGQRPVAFVDGPVDDRSLAALVSHLAVRLPRFKIPVAFYGWPQDADAGDMKPNRVQFRKRAEALLKAKK